MKDSQSVELYTGTMAAKAAGYDTYQAFSYAFKRYPIPDQGHRHNGKPAWTAQHLKEWRESVPAPGRKSR